MESFFKTLGFNKVVTTLDADWDTINGAYTEVSRQLAKAHKDKSHATKILLFVYYSGHGVMDTTTKLVVNEEDADLRYFPLESKLSILSGYRNTYIVTIFDCCREKLPKEEQRGEGVDTVVKK